jgi:TonB-linked SusC/RagA family outer membrane protein
MIKICSQCIFVLILLANTVFILNAQETTIKVGGKVTDQVTGLPLTGATIIVEGTNIGVITDAEGQYFLEIPSADVELKASFIGYVSVKESFTGSSTINFNLQPELIALDEIAVVGYGVQKRSNITGAISSVKVENMENKSQLRLDQVLQGMSSGVFVSQNGGAPGSQPTIHIRGVGSINNTEPLYIIDGVRMAPGNFFDIDDVESIEILKDASSSAIYGAKAAHGVILITTKKGKGDTQVSFKTSFGKRMPIKLPELLGREDYIKYKNESRLNSGQNPLPNWDMYPANTDWIKEFYGGSGMLKTYDFSVSKGDEKYNFYFSLGNDNEEGILINNTYKRYSSRINSDINLTKWFKLGENLLLSKVKENPIDNFNENYTGAIPFRSIPIMPVRDANNPYGGWGKAPVYFQGPNPVASQSQQHETRDYNRIDGSLYGELTPVEGFMIKGTLGYNYAGFLGEKFQEAFNYGSFSNTINSLTYSTASDANLSANLVATYDKSFRKHTFRIMGGYEASQYQSVHFNLIGTNFPIDVARSMNLSGGSFNATDRANLYQSRMLSQFGRFNYNYNEKYLFEANIRRDASAPKFGPSNIWGIFPSFSAGWVLSKESFFENIPGINFVKIRASSGKLGSDNIGSFIYLKTYTSQFTSYAFDQYGSNKVSGFFISKFPNEDVKWEEVNMHNAGIDLRALGNKLTMSIDFYIKDTKDLLYGVPIPPSVGIAVHNFSPVNPELNIGTLRNSGIDIEMGYTWQIDRFSLNLTGNTSFMKNEMRSLNKGQYIIGGDGGGQIGGMTKTEAGMPISSFYGYRVQQMLNTPSDIFAINSYAEDGTYQEGGTGPGDFMYVDISGPNGKPDGQITAEHDRVYLGNPWPKMTYALNAGLVYNKMFDISLQFQGIQGVDVFNADKAYTRNFFGDANTSTLIYEAWTPEHFSNNPRNIANDPNGNFSKPSDYFVENGSYLKLRNAQIGFNMPGSVLKKIHLPKLRIYVNANNLLTITKYSGIDPEIAGSNTSRGVDYGLYPQVRTISGGIEVNF